MILFFTGAAIALILERIFYICVGAEYKPTIWAIKKVQKTFALPTECHGLFSFLIFFKVIQFTILATCFILFQGEPLAVISSIIIFAASTLFYLYELNQPNKAVYFVTNLFGALGIAGVIYVTKWVEYPLISIIGVSLFIIGQTLNYTASKKLGLKTMCYGAIFGYKTSWVSSFPYNLTSDPQYIGALISIWGIYLVAYPLTNLSILFFIIPLIETIYYLPAGQTEQFFIERTLKKRGQETA